MRWQGIRSFGKDNITLDGFDLEHVEWRILDMLPFLRQGQRTRHMFQNGWAMLIWLRRAR